MKLIARAHVLMLVPDYTGIARAVIKDFMPKAGKMVMGRAWSKIGTYQAGWAPLAPSTLRKKRRSLKRMGKRAPWMRLTGGGADQPLLDRGKMANSIGHSERGNHQTTIFANFPMGQHEQDPQVADFRIPIGIPLPARPVLWPSMTEMLPDIIDELEQMATGRL